MVTGRAPGRLTQATIAHCNRMVTEPETVLGYTARDPHEARVARDHFATILLMMGQEFTYDGADILLGNGSRLHFECPVPLPVVLRC